MPKFIYTIIVIIIINLTGIYFVLTNTSPESNLNKIIFSVLIFFLILFLIPLIKTLYYFLIKTKEDCNIVFKTSFKKNLFLAFYIGSLVYLKTVFNFNFYLFFGLILSFVILTKIAPHLRKSRKKPKY
jgi:hypothetical protein